MTWILISGVVLIALGAYLAGVASGPRVRGACRSLDDKRRSLRKPAAAPYAPRHAESLPRRKPLLNRQPWQTAEMPAIRVPAAQLALDPGDGLDEVALARPYVAATAQEMREEYFAPVYGEAPQDAVDEAQRLAGQVTA